MQGWPNSLLGLMFIATFVGVALWEAFRPARASVSPLGLRWFGNVTMLVLPSLIAWLLPFLSSYGAAEFAARRGWGLFHLVSVAPLLVLTASMVLLDFFAYWTHRLMHILPLWRLHALHHSDTDLDVTTTIRHHPAEVVAQSGLDAVLALLFGFPPQAVALYGGVALV